MMAHSALRQQRIFSWACLPVCGCIDAAHNRQSKHDGVGDGPRLVVDRPVCVFIVTRHQGLLASIVRTFRSIPVLAHLLCSDQGALQQVQSELCRPQMPFRKGPSAHLPAEVGTRSEGSLRQLLFANLRGRQETTRNPISHASLAQFGHDNHATVFALSYTSRAIGGCGKAGGLGRQSLTGIMSGAPGMLQQLGSLPEHFVDSFCDPEYVLSKLRLW